MIRSRARWIEEGEKPSKYFCNLESRNFLNKTIRKIYVEGIGMVYEQTEILDNIRSYYEKSYKSTESNLVDIELGNLFNNYNIPKLDNETANGLEHDILESGVFMVLTKKK